MPRVARIYTDDGIFHVLTRGNNKQWVFHDEEDFFKYKEIIKEVKEEQPFKLYHYCLMSNHVHLLIENLIWKKRGQVCNLDIWLSVDIITLCHVRYE